MDSPIAATGADSLASFDSSTFAVDLGWQAPPNASGSGSIVYAIFLVGQSSSDPVFLASTTATTYLYPISDTDFGMNESFAIQAVDGVGNQSELATTTVAIPAWFLAIQPYNVDDSRSSWYDDNWYELGTGLLVRSAR